MIRIVSARRLSFLALVASSAPLAAQEVPGAPPREAVVVRDGPEVPLTAAHERVVEDPGLPVIEERSPVRRPVPLPNAAEWAPSDAGDVLVAPASGDPYFIGFAGGELRAAPGERVDGALVERLVFPPVDMRPTRTTYAYAMLDATASPALAAELEAAGARVLGFRPHQAFALALDAEALARIEALDFVHWVGVSRPHHKLHPRITLAFRDVGPGAPGDLVVSVFESDLHAASRRETVSDTHVGRGGLSVIAAPAGERVHSEGWQQRALETLGVEVREYLPSIHAFRVRASFADVGRIAALDFVEFVEADVPVRPLHDDSQPMIGADFIRGTFDGAWSGEALGGVIDTGFRTAHTGLDHVYHIGWSTDGSSPWIDLCGHGSHVLGTVVALPHAALLELSGTVPGLGTHSANRALRLLKIGKWTLGNECQLDSVSHETMFSYMRSTFSDGGLNVPRPHFVNNSWGSKETGGWLGTEANARAVDAEVWSTNQVYVFSAGNEGPVADSLTLEASAKNAISVGNVLPHRDGTVGLPATLWTSSSRGPTGDSRWKPNVVAPGRSIYSVNENSSQGYVTKTGTSMAAPHVAGVVGQLVDRHSFLRYAPARVASVLMATAHTKGNVAHVVPGSTHLNQYGAGRVDAVRAVVPDAQHSWFNWGFTLTANQDSFQDFTVEPGATRLVVVMHYIEAAASAGASQALVNDFDLVLDAAPFAAGISQGDYFSHQSARNNTEIRSINNPQTGAWRWKVFPASATSSVRMSVTVHVIYGATNPNPTLTLTASDAFVKPNDQVAISATVTNASHVASAVHLDTTNSTSATLLSSQMVLKDGITANLLDNINNQFGFDATLGNIRFGTNRRVDWTARWASQGTKTWSVTGTSDNGMDRTASVQIVVDGTPPGNATNFTSPTHTPNVWSSNPDVTVSWSAATDDLAGIAGYARSTGTSPSSPLAIMNLGAVTTFTMNDLATNSSGWYLNLRAVDKSGNWGTSYAFAGPYRIDTLNPGTATSLTSTSHTENVWSNNPVISMQWTAATDQHSGIDGYSHAFSALPILPSATKTLGVVTTMQSPPLASSTTPRYFTLRSVDKAGNWGSSFASAGPYRIDVTSPVVTSAAITNGASPIQATASTDVTIAVSASDAHSGLTTMRFKNDGGAWSPWMFFSGSQSWSLLAHGGSGATGTRTVSIEVRDAASNVTAASATVYYYRPHWLFGPPGSGAMGAPGVQVTGIFGKGKQATIRVVGTSAPWRRLVLGASNTQWSGLPLPLDLGLIGAPGNTLLVSPDLVLYEGLGDEVVLSVPPHAGTAGAVLYLQWLLFGDPSGAPVVTTQGIAFELNGL